jgi:CO dehydrogenase maturation factor
MRIAVAGKGGAGKTTISATAARIFASLGYQVNALDDDPNPNLAAALGLSSESINRLRRVERDEILAERETQEGKAELYLTRPFDEVIDNYGAVGPDGVRTLTMTGLLGAGRG